MILSLLVGVMLAPLAISTVVLAIELALGAKRAQPVDLPPQQTTSLHDVVVLIPAHNEEAIIGTTIESTLASAGQLEIVVVADNCTDRTAAVARDHGARVVERYDPLNRGKAFALHAGRAAISTKPPQHVIVIDADTFATQGAIAKLVERTALVRQPVQGAYYLEFDAATAPIPRFSALAFYVKNVVRQLALTRLGSPVVLTGSGMAFPWSVFQSLELQSPETVEDLVLGLQCVLQGNAPHYEDQAIFLSQVSTVAGTSTQRRRWESGFIRVGWRMAPRLFGHALASRRFRIAWLGLHLLVPPLVLLFTLDAVALVATTGLLGLGGPAWPLLLILVPLLGATISLVRMLASYKLLSYFRDWRVLAKYLVWKLTVSGVALVRRQRAWVRTERS